MAQEEMTGHFEQHYKMADSQLIAVYSERLNSLNIEFNSVDEVSLRKDKIKVDYYHLLTAPTSKDSC